MKKEQHNIDDLFNKGFEGFEPIAPPLVWDNVQSQLKKRKRLRLLPFLWSGSLIAAGFLGYYFGSQQCNSTNNETAQSTTLQTQYRALNENMATSQPQGMNFSNSPTFSKLLSPQQNEQLPIRSSNQSKRKVASLTPIATQDATTIATVVDSKSTISEQEQNAKYLAEPTQSHTTQTILPLIPTLPLVALYRSTIIDFKKARKEDCYNFQKKNWEKPALELYVGGFYAMPRFATKGNEPNNYRNLRDSAEQYALAGDVGFWLNSVHRSGIGVRTGLHASRWIEKLRFTNAYEEKYQMIVTQTKDNQGNVVKNDTSFGWVRGRLVQKYYNHYTALNIPFQIGFEYLKPTRTQFFAYAGAMLNLRFWAKGEILNPSEQIMSYPKPNKVFQNNIGLSLSGHFGVRHRLSEHWWITESLQSNYTFKSITSDTHPLEQRVLNLGVQIGLRYKF
jgi:hypothetical protein